MAKKPTISVIGLSGESLFFEVDHFNEEGETIIANSFHSEPGGKGFNQAVALKALGANVNFFTITGDDAYSSVIEQELTNRGITTHIYRVKEEKTAKAIILTNKQGDNRVCVYSGATNKIDPSIVDAFEDSIASSDFLLLQLEYPLSTLKRAISIAKKYNIKVIINPAPAVENASDLLLEAFLITPNESEAKAILGLNQNATIEELVERLVFIPNKNAVITLGGLGSIVIELGNQTIIPSLKVKKEEVVDTTGAGDIYTSAVVYKLACGETLVDAARFASNVAGLSVKKKYVINAIPYETKN